MDLSHANPSAQPVDAPVPGESSAGLHDGVTLEYTKPRLVDLNTGETQSGGSPRLYENPTYGPS